MSCRSSSTSGQPGAAPAACSAPRSRPRSRSGPGKIELAKIDVDAEQALAAQYGIQSIPTVAVFRDGKPVSGFVGAHPAATIGSFLDDTIEKHGEAVDAA